MCTMAGSKNCNKSVNAALTSNYDLTFLHLKSDLSTISGGDVMTQAGCITGD